MNISNINFSEVVHDQSHVIHAFLVRHFKSTPLVNQISFTANLDIKQLSKDANGYTTLVFTGPNASQNVRIRMNTTYNDIYRILVKNIGTGKMDHNTQISVIIKQSKTKSAIYLRATNKTNKGDIVVPTIVSIAESMSIEQYIKQAA